MAPRLIVETINILSRGTDAVKPSSSPIYPFGGACPALSCSSLSPSLHSYTLHDLILAVLTAYKQGLFDAHIASPSQSYTNPPAPTVITPSNDPSSFSSPSVADSGSAAPLPSLQQGDVPPTTAADNPTPPTISPPLDYSCLIDSLSLGKSGYPLVVPSKSHRSSSTRPTVKPCSSSGTHRQHNRKPGHRSTKSSSESPKKTTIISPTNHRVPSPPIIRPSSPTPIPTHNRFDTIAIPEEENSTDFTLAILQPLINQAINDAENKSVVQSVLIDICDRVVSSAVVVYVDTPSIHPTPSSIITTKQKKKKNKETSPAASESPNAPSPITDTSFSSPPPAAAAPSLVDINLAYMSTPIDSNINEAERLSAIVEEKVSVEIEKKENPVVSNAQPLSSSQSKKIKKQNKMVKKEVVANRTRNKMRAARRMKKQEKELEGLSREESGEKLIEILAECAGKKGRRFDDDDDDDIDEVWYDPSCDIAEEDLMEFGNRW